MPTGYTADIYEGKDVTFREFALKCARAFTYFIEQRDEGLDSPPRKIAERSYYDERLEEVIRERDEFLNMDEASRKELWRAYAERVRLSNESSEVTAAEHRRRYGDMLSQVEAWDCDPDLDSLKQFMIKQLTGDLDFYGKPYLSRVLPFDEWEQDELARSDREVEYYTEQIEKDRERVRAQHEYTDKLYASLASV